MEPFLWQVHTHPKIMPIMIMRSMASSAPSAITMSELLSIIEPALPVGYSVLVILVLLSKLLFVYGLSVVGQLHSFNVGHSACPVVGVTSD